MNNLKEAILLAIIASNQPFFTWDSRTESVLAVMALTVFWWCLLTWKDDVRERFEGYIKHENDEQ